MKLLSLVFFSVFVFSFSYSQQIENPDITFDKELFKKYKQNRIKTQKTKVVVLDSIGKPVKEKGKFISTEYDSLHSYYKETIYRIGDTIYNHLYYSRKGDLVKFINHIGDAKNKGSFKYRYDSIGNMTQLFKFDNKRQLISYEEKIYNQIVVNSTVYDEKGKILIKEKVVYDTLNNIYTSQILSSERDLLYQHKYFLNSGLQLIQHNLTDYKQDIKSKIFYSYDTAGNRTEKLITDNDGKPIERIVNIYNDKGLLIKTTWYNPVDVRKQISSFEYEYF